MKNRLIQTWQKCKNLLSTYGKKHYFYAGKTKISFFDFVKFFWEGIRNESISIRASALSFKIFLSFFPALVFLVTLLPYISGKHFQDTFIQMLGSIMPEYSFKAFESTITDVLYNPQFGLLSVFFVLVLFYSVSNMNSILSTFNKSFYIVEKRSWLNKIFVSLIMTILFFTLIIVVLALISFNQNIILWLKNNQFIQSTYYLQIIQYSRWLLLFLMILFGLSIFYTITPAQKVKLRFITPGSFFASFFFIIISVVFNFVVNHFASYNKIYGVLGVVLVFFMWLYYNAVVILIGFEINTSIYIAPQIKKKSDEM